MSQIPLHIKANAVIVETAKSRIQESRVCLGRMFGLQNKLKPHLTPIPPPPGGLVCLRSNAMVLLLLIQLLSYYCCSPNIIIFILCVVVCLVLVYKSDLKPVLGGVRIVALSISFHEQTQ